MGTPKRTKRRSPLSLIRGPRSLEIFDGQYVLCTRHGKAESYKFLSPASVHAAFRNAPIDTGWLPTNVIRCGATPKGEFAVIFIPAQAHTIEVETERGRSHQELTIPLPSFIFLGFGHNYSVWSIKGNTPEATTQLFHAPLPNVFGNGGVCWGANQPPGAATTTINQAWQLFMSSPFNSHAATGKAKNYHSDIRPLLRQLGKKKTAFPTSELLEASNTLDATITKIITAE